MQQNDICSRRALNSNKRIAYALQGTTAEFSRIRVRQLCFTGTGSGLASLSLRQGVRRTAALPFYTGGRMDRIFGHHEMLIVYRSCKSMPV